MARHTHVATERSAPAEMPIGTEIVTYQRCKCACGYEWNDITHRRTA